MDRMLIEPKISQENQVCVPVDADTNQVIEAVSRRIDRSDIEENQESDDDVFVAVALPRLKSHDAFFITGVFTLIEHDNGAILSAPRIVAEWLRNDGVNSVVGIEQRPEPVQILERDIEISDLETAIFLWEPLNAHSVYGSFEAALFAAAKLSKS